MKDNSRGLANAPRQPSAGRPKAGEPSGSSDLPYYDPAFPTAPMPVSDTSDWFVRAELGLPLHVQLAAATYISVGPSITFGMRGLSLLFGAGVGRFF